ncbi:MAG: P-loop NTPase [Candidatus Aenigmarchaeota archaeon]|nr:P-loop NTPase [Candidatus Aenigmarchaeota archaeon]
MAKVIGILSGKGGVGKTTLVSNLAASLTKNFNKNVLVFDTNINTSHLGLHLGMYEDLPVTLREVLRRKTSIMHAVYTHPNTGIRLVPAPLSGDGINLTKEKCCRLVNQLKNSYDMVILDCPPGLGKETIVAISAIDEAIIITTPDIPAVTDALKTVEILNRIGKKTLGIVVNRSRNEKYELQPQEISSTCKCDVIATIPEDRKILRSISKGMPAVLLYPHSPASNSVKKLAAKLLGKSYKEPSFFDKLKRLLGRNEEGDTKIVIKEQEQAVSKEAEIRDVKKLKEGLTKEVKEELKREIVEMVKKKLKEKVV